MDNEVGEKMKKYIKKLKTAVTIYFSRFINLIFIIFTRLDKNKILFLKFYLKLKSTI